MFVPTEGALICLRFWMVQAGGMVDLPVVTGAGEPEAVGQCGCHWWEDLIRGFEG